MIPHHLEVLCHCIVWHSLIARFCNLIVRLQRTRIFIAFIIVRQPGEPPRAFRKDIPRHLQVHDVTDGKVISPLCQTETTAGVVHISRHDKTGRITAGEREEEERNSQRQGNIFHHQIGRPRHHILFGTHLRTRQLHVEVRMIMMVAGCITSVLHKDFVICAFLRLATGHIALTLLGDDVRDARLLGLEVIADRLRIVRSIPLLEYRLAFFHSGGVLDAVSMNGAAVQVHRNHLGSQFYILIIDLSATVKRSGTAQREDGRVV